MAGQGGFYLTETVFLDAGIVIVVHTVDAHNIDFRLNLDQAFRKIRADKTRGASYQNFH